MNIEINKKNIDSLSRVNKEITYKIFQLALLCSYTNIDVNFTITKYPIEKYDKQILKYQQLTNKNILVIRDVDSIIEENNIIRINNIKETNNIVRTNNIVETKDIIRINSVIESNDNIKNDNINETKDKNDMINKNNNVSEMKDENISEMKDEIIKKEVHIKNAIIDNTTIDNIIKTKDTIETKDEIIKQEVHIKNAIIDNCIIDKEINTNIQIDNSTNKTEIIKLKNHYNMIIYKYETEFVYVIYDFYTLHNIKTICLQIDNMIEKDKYELYDHMNNVENIIRFTMEDIQKKYFDFCKYTYKFICINDLTKSLYNKQFNSIIELCKFLNLKINLFNHPTFLIEPYKICYHLLKYKEKTIIYKKNKIERESNNKIMFSLYKK